MTHPFPRRHWRRVLLPAAMTVGALVAGSTPALAAPAAPAAGSPAGATAARPAPAVKAFSGGVKAAVPKLTWRACYARFRCATATVPLDYRKPAGAKISLALVKLPAADPRLRLGSLFVNPGGPGGSGVDFVVGAARQLYSPSVLTRFDVIGFDPRGVARSNPVYCFRSGTEQFEFFRTVPVLPVGTAEERVFVEAYKRYTALCRRNAGPIASHMSTANVARDMDLLRQAVGDRGLTYAGYSYGTYLGEMYAALFPNRVRALVVDGVLDPEEWSTGETPAERRLPFSTRIRSDLGAYESLQAFFRLCRAGGPERCAFAAGGDPAAKYQELATRLLRGPLDLPNGDGTTSEFRYGDLVFLTLSALYDPSGYEFLGFFLQDIYTAPDPAAAAAAVTRLRARLGLPRTAVDPADPPGDSSFEGVSCTDTVNPRDPYLWPKVAKASDRRYPYFGSAWTYASQACATWPFKDPNRYLGPFTKRTARPVLVVGNRYDPATRYQAAVELSRSLPGSRLLSLAGYGHTTLGQSGCIDTKVAEYLVYGKLPRAGTVCQPDFVPFSAAEESGAVTRTAAATPAAKRAAARVAKRLEVRRKVVVDMLPKEAVRAGRR